MKLSEVQVPPQPLVEAHHIAAGDMLLVADKLGWIRSMQVQRVSPAGRLTLADDSVYDIRRGSLLQRAAPELSGYGPYGSGPHPWELFRVPAGTDLMLLDMEYAEEAQRRADVEQDRAARHTLADDIRRIGYRLSVHSTVQELDLPVLQSIHRELGELQKQAGA